MRTLTGIEEVKAARGETIGTSSWHLVTQRDIQTFAEITGDHQWIHVDVERARASAFGGTIAHGFFTLALAPRVKSEVLRFEGFAYALNYGLNRVRFPAPLPVGAEVRGVVTLPEVDDVRGGIQVTTEVTFERNGGDKPVCVAQLLVRLFTDQVRSS